MYGRYVGTPNVCDLCGEVPPRGMKNGLWRKRWMWMHVRTAHVQTPGGSQ